MVGGAVEGQLDACMEQLSGSVAGAANDSITGSTTAIYNMSTSTATIGAMNFTVPGNSSMAGASSGSNSDELKCRVAIASTLTLLVGLCQVKIMLQ